MLGPPRPVSTDVQQRSSPSKPSPHIWHVPSPPHCAKQQKHNYKGVLLVFGMSLHPSLYPLLSRHKEHDPGVSLTLSFTLYHPDTKNMTPGSRSSHLGPPSTLSFIFYYPDMKNMTPGSRSVPHSFLHPLPPFPLPSTTQTRRM